MVAHGRRFPPEDFLELRVKFVVFIFVGCFALQIYSALLFGRVEAPFGLLR
jgi:hypothetical protein